MELKSHKILEESVRNLCSNRTFMELKFLGMRSMEREGLSSNRTFMELK